MVLFYQSCKSVMTSVVTGPGRNIFGSLHTCSYNVGAINSGIVYLSNLGGGGGGGSGGGVASGTIVQFWLTEGQRNMLQQVHDMYSLMLASRQYDKIPANYEQYLDLLSNLQTIDTPDSTTKMLLDIVERTLIGCMNVIQIYQSATYNELQILLLNNRIDDILTNKNKQNVIADDANVSGQFAATKVFKLSKFYSYYIYLYGMPEFGVGFDPAKLTFLKNALELFDQTHIKVPDKIFVPPTDASGNGPHLGPDIPPPPPPNLPYEVYQESIFEIGYAVNIYEHLMDYQTIYPLGFYIVALLDVPPPPEVPPEAFGPTDAEELLQLISYYSEVAGLGGLDSSGGLPTDVSLNVAPIFTGTDDQLALVTGKLAEVESYVLDKLHPGRPILSHTLIPGGADVFTSKYASYTFYYSTVKSIIEAFKQAHAVYGENLRTSIFQEYNMESKAFTVMDHCGNIYVQNIYQGVV